MQAHGGDRVRTAGGKLILHSALPKGWTPRTPPQGTHREHPGTAVLWDDVYYEVLVAEATGSGVRYVLGPWSDEHTIRTFEAYDESSEERRRADHAAVRAQKAGSFAVTLLSFLVGHLPGDVQTRLAHHYGVNPARMTIVSAAIGPVLVGICVWQSVSASLVLKPSPIPLWLWGVAALMFIDSVMRFFVAMSQSRPMGSLPGCTVYLLYQLITPTRGTTSSRTRASAVAQDEEAALRDELQMKGPLLSLLTPAEQARMKERYGFDYRRHAYGLTWIILVACVVGVVTSIVKVADSGSVSAAVALVVAGIGAVEQITRLSLFPRRPAGSILAPLVRPFVRDLLEQR